MHCAIKTVDLHAGLDQAEHAAAASNTLPILSHVLLTVHDGTLTLTCNDLSLIVETQVPVLDAGDGAVAVPIKLLKALIGKLRDDDLVTLTTDDDHRLTIAAPNKVFTLQGLPGEEFPATHVLTSRQALTMEAQGLLLLLRRVLYAVATDETRVVLTGAHLMWKDKQLTVAGTDTHRLAVQTVETPDTAALAEAEILPAYTCRMLAKIIGKRTDTVTIRFCTDPAQEDAVIAMTFELSGLRIISRLIEGVFPAHDRVIPTERKSRINIATDDLRAALDRAALVASTASNKVILSITDVGAVRLTTQTDAGHTVETLTADVSDGVPEIAFNVDYLLDALSVFDCTPVTLAFTEALQPIKLTADLQSGHTAVIMPIQAL